MPRPGELHAKKYRDQKAAITVPDLAGLTGRLGSDNCESGKVEP